MFTSQCPKTSRWTTVWLTARKWAANRGPRSGLVAWSTRICRRMRAGSSQERPCMKNSSLRGRWTLSNSCQLNRPRWCRTSPMCRPSTVSSMAEAVWTPWDPTSSMALEQAPADSTRSMCSREPRFLASSYHFWIIIRCKGILRRVEEIL